MTIRRTTGPGPLTRAVFEYAVVFVLAVLVATTGIPVDQPPTTGGQQASAAADQRPALVKTIDGFRDLARPMARVGPHRDRPPPHVLIRPRPHTQGRDPARPPAPPTRRTLLVTKFRHLPLAGRLIIVAVAIGVFAIAVVACATSYNAIYRLVGDLGLYGYRINQLFPLMLDAAFLVAELAAILGGIMRAVTRSDEVSAGWPGTTMLLCGAGTIGFNVAHAYLIGGRGDPLTVWRCVVASLPPC